MKYILASFLNLLYPRENIEDWKWGEIIFYLTVIAGVFALLASSN